MTTDKMTIVEYAERVTNECTECTLSRRDHIQRAVDELIEAMTVEHKVAWTVVLDESGHASILWNTHELEVWQGLTLRVGRLLALKRLLGIQ